MKNLMVYNKVDFDPDNMYGHSYDLEVLKNQMRLQIDNSIRFGWKPEDIIIGCNFPFEFRGVKSVLLKNICKHNNFFNKFYGILELYERKILTDIAWFHDLDSFQINEFECPGFVGDMGICTYVYNEEYNTCSMFLKPSCVDMVRSVVEAMENMKTNPQRVSDEHVVSGVITHNPKMTGRHSKLNNEFNVGLTHFAKRYDAANKPVKVIGFNPTVKKGFDVYVHGKNERNVKLVDD